MGDLSASYAYACLWHQVLVPTPLEPFGSSPFATIATIAHTLYLEYSVSVRAAERHAHSAHRDGCPTAATIADCAGIVPGEYSVTVYEAELDFMAPGDRVFNISCNGALEYGNVDIYAEVRCLSAALR